ncbi:UDP-N-acetylglucosamine:LPS N-acetylglucosamine transferase [Halopolyspora algeriensis]|uniref:UDP-N-acetylglucosamine:LPS N-acetylglucosamine transferase n=1 Tax=Halopolyspora algeriensis TaxID=1500506 RepID=A0A368VVR0_9ACTN|nr:glycosyltransferase [Halopolyspora algeriensis]RCW46186.1 UDP-N-acetylglucosamine:LPS N-acetylglucosamine transferase [Halopolyspora algeriensis]TQM55589.1 UDP-N-acetylglucosamine:LPS N-acetylglucosamine transferase [Halopolyspora algeriensis]
MTVDVEAAVDSNVSGDRAPASQRILIVSAAMGGGHLQISRELERRLLARGHEVLIADLNRLMPGPTGRWLERLYPWLVDRVPRLYEVIYERFFRARQRTGERVRVPVLLSLPGMRRLIARFRPHVVASTYHLSALAVAHLRGRGELHCPAVTVITTFSVHDLWTHPDADLNVCISAEAAQEARLRSGRPAVVCGPVVRPGFGEPHPQPERIRHDIGAPSENSIALVVAGSLGMGSIERAVTAIAAHPGWVPVVVCGRNEQLRRRVEQLRAGIVLGWVEDMAGLMAAADVLVENAGGLSAKEALVCGLPVVSFRPITGHGRDDTEALARLGLTDIVLDEQGLLGALDELNRDPRQRRERVARGKELVAADPTRIIERMAEGRQVRTDSS